MKISELFEDYKPKYIALPKTDTLDDASPQIRFVDYSKKLVEFIRTNCSPWLDQTNNGDAIVYRGIKSSTDKSEIAFVKDTRADRKPRDSLKRQHEIFCKIISDAGLKANRYNSIFVTGKFGHALQFSRSEFDDPYVVLPIGDFHFTWNKIVKDWTEEPMPEDSEEMEKESIRKLKSGLQGDDGSLKAAILSGHEIMISCGSALYVNCFFYQHYLRKMLHNEQPYDGAWKNIPSELL